MGAYSDLYNVCQRCDAIKGAAFEARACTFKVGGYEPTYHLCKDCRDVVIDRLETVLEISEEEQVAVRKVYAA